MAFVWRTGAGGLESQLNLSARAELAVRIVISAILGLGVLYFALILNTLRRYGDSMDKQFKRDLELMTKAKRQRSHAYGPGYSNPQYYSNMTAGGPHAMGNYPTHKWFRPAKAIDFRFHVRSSKQMPDYLLDRSFTQEKWEKFISEAYNAWNGLTTGPFSVGDSGASTSRPQDVVARLLEKWNQKYFQPRSTLGILCHEYIDLFPDSPVFAIYIIDATLVDGQLLPLSIAERFGPVPEGLSRIDIFDRPAHDKQVTRRILGRTSIFSSRNPLDGRVRFPDQETIRSPSELYNMHDNSYLTTQPPHLPQPIRPPIFVPPLRQPRSKSPEIEPSPSNSIDESGKFRPRSRSRSTLSESPSRDRDSLSRTEPARRHTRRRRSASMSTFEHLSGLPPVTPTITPQFMGPRSDFDVPPPTDNKGGWMFVPPGWQGNVYPTRTDIGALTPNTFPTVTPSAISNLDILVPPSMQNQRWAPYQRPPHPVQPIQGYNQPWPNLAEMLSDNDPQQSAAAAAAPPMSVDRARRRRRHRSREQQLPAESNADLPTVANPDPPESLPDVPGDPVDRNPRRRSTSTSYRSFSHSPPRGLSDPSLDPLGSSPNAGHLEGDEQGVGGTSSHIPLHRGRDVTPRAERAPVDHHQEPMGAEAGGGLPGTSTSTSSTPGQAPQEPDPIVNEPWTRYYHYLRTTYNVA
ncbi:hypothetical protein H0H87_005228 [Tephrocybe sp. NHM501043]|nr:hypothetical protein H0H87_005228 [Tephrocybe sp. NHM501043]